MKTKKIGLRHGDLALISISKLPTGLKKANTDIAMNGSHRNDHIAVNCELYFKQVDQFIFGYLVAGKNAKLKHKEHGNKKVNGFNVCDIPEGIYEMRKQFEETNEGMVAVID